MKQITEIKRNELNDSQLVVLKKGKEIKDLTLTYSCCRKTQRTVQIC